MKHILQLVVILTGTGLIAAGKILDWGLTATMAGIFFINIGVMTLLIDCSKISGFWQKYLRSSAFSFFIILSVVGLLVATVVIGVLAKIGIIH